MSGDAVERKAPPTLRGDHRLFPQSLVRHRWPSEWRAHSHSRERVAPRRCGDLAAASPRAANDAHADGHELLRRFTAIATFHLACRSTRDARQFACALRALLRSVRGAVEPVIRRETPGVTPRRVFEAPVAELEEMQRRLLLGDLPTADEMIHATDFLIVQLVRALPTTRGGSAGSSSPF